MTPTEAEDEDAPLSAADFAALDRAIRTYSDRTQIERKLATETWREAAEFAAYGCQMDSLHLRPWQPPPCR